MSDKAKKVQPKGRWIGVKAVRANNSPEFIEAFRNASRCAVMSDQTGKIFEIKKVDVWYVAMRSKVHYRVSEHKTLFVL